MKVLLTTDTEGGVWTYAIELAAALNALGHDVELAAMGRPLTIAQRADARTLPRTALHAAACALEWMEEPWQDVRRCGDWLLDLERRTTPDVVHLNQYAFGALPWPLPPLIVAHSCVCSWWEAVHGADAPGSWDRYRAEVRSGLDGAALVVAPSAAMLGALQRQHGPLPHEARVIYNGRSPAPFPPQPKAPCVLSIGRLWDEAKNVAALGRAAAQVSWPVYVAGDTEAPDGTRAEPGAAHLLGPLCPADVAAWLGRAAIYALPARYEPFGFSALEAALAGAALVLGDIDSLREIWDGAASFVPPDDEAALAATLGALIENPGRRDALARRGRERALAFSPERMARAYLDVYDVTLRRPRGDATGALACMS
jgi:glycosyltransferase involved in cell wall biosynthesis